MREFLEKLQAEINANAGLSITDSDVTALISSTTELDHAGQAEGESAPEQYNAAIAADQIAAIDEWFDEDNLHDISDKVVIAHLDEILLVLIGIRDGACGKKLLQDVRHLFGTDLSPGTVYPHLSALADDNTLEATELTKRKVYYISDVEAALDVITPAVNRLLIFSLVLKTLSVNCNARQSQTQGGDTHEQ